MAKLTKDEFISAIEGMTVIELADLVEALQEKFNVTAAAPVAAVAVQASGAAGGEAAEEKSEFTVVFVSGDESKKINIIKEVRAITGLGLKEAKDLVEKGGETLKEGVSKAEADDIKKKIEAAGGKIEVK